MRSAVWTAERKKINQVMRDFQAMLSEQTRRV
jgi:hypothetical protein